MTNSNSAHGLKLKQWLQDFADACLPEEYTWELITYDGMWLWYDDRAQVYQASYRATNAFETIIHTEEIPFDVLQQIDV